MSLGLGLGMGQTPNRAGEPPHLSDPRPQPGAEAAHHRAETEQTAAGIAHLRDVGELLRSHPLYAAPQDRVEAVLALARSGAYTGLLPDTTDGP
ncbi:hypothetical protein ACU686_36860 [Yinghuangia aomiensis]